MKNIQSIELFKNSNEEILPGFSEDFPYIASRALLDRYIEPFTPWHWHRTVELFYMESGILEYTTPNGKWLFTAGSGGFVNSNVLHTSKVVSSGEETIQLLHLFEPELIAGEQSCRLYEKYVHPVTSASGIEIIALSAEDGQQANILRKIRCAFDTDEKVWGYEFELRQKLSEIWLDLFELVRPSMVHNTDANISDEKLKAMMLYIHQHYPEKITIDQLATQLHISKRVCFRLFREKLHMSPVEYITNYRLRKACQKLVETNDPITQVAYSCGLGSSSYFGKLFRGRFGCSPLEYRSNWHNRNII